MSECNWGRCGWITKAIVSGDIHFMFLHGFSAVSLFIYFHALSQALHLYFFSSLFHISKDSICKLLYSKSFLLWSRGFFRSLSCLCGVSLFFLLLWINPQGFPPCTCTKKWSIERCRYRYTRVREWERQRQRRRLNERRFNSRLVCMQYVYMELRSFRLDLIEMAIAVIRNVRSHTHT